MNGKGFFKRRGKLYKNSAAALISQTLRMLAAFFIQKAFVTTLSVEYIGYNSVFKDILQLLNLTDLGIGIAITGFLYKPLAEKNEEEIGSLMYLYTRIYRFITIFVAFIGLFLSLFIRVIIPDARCSYGMLRVYFLIYLAQTVSTYLVADCRMFLMANEKSYFVNTIDMICFIGGTVIQFMCLLFMPSYLVYLILGVGEKIVSNLIIKQYCKKNLNFTLLSTNQEIIRQYKNKLLPYAGSVAFNRIGNHVINWTDGLVISMNLGSLITGFLSNYTIFTTAIRTTANVLFVSLQSSYGKYVFTKKNTTNEVQMFRSCFYLSFLMAILVVSCSVSLFPPFVSLFYGEEYVLSFTTTLLISLNLGLSIIFSYLTQVFSIYKLYPYEKRFIVIINILNLVLSFILVRKFGINGTLCVTTFVLFLCVSFRVFVISTKVFDISIFSYFKMLLKYTFMAVLGLISTIIITKGIKTISFFRLIWAFFYIVCFVFLLFFFLMLRSEECKFIIEEIFPLGVKIYVFLIASVLGLAVVSFIMVK